MANLLSKYSVETSKIQHITPQNAGGICRL
jgi:hypothetical protein